MQILAVRTLIATALCLAAWPAAAMYKVVQADGSVTYTDRPPVGGNARVTAIGRNAGSDASGPALPLELRQAMQRYPVTLYTANDCGPCDAGRQLLQQRGVPFSERRILSEDDAAALERLVGGRSVPAVSIGNQPLRGLSQSDWNAYLDAAGYPKTSMLPRNWPVNAATPLVERRAPLAAAPAPAAAEPTAAPEPPAEPPQPGAIRF
jgi:glutaredoxin